LEWSQVNKKILDFQTSADLKETSEAFIYYSLNRILGIDINEITSCITDGQFDRGIDAIFIESSENRKIIHLFQMKCYENFKPTARNFPSNETSKILSFLDDLLQASDNMESTCNSLLYSKVKTIWDLLAQEPYDIHIHFCTNAQNLEETHRDSFLSTLRSRSQYIVLKEYDLNTMSAIEVGSRKKERTLSIKLFEENNFERSDGAMRGLIGSIKAQELIKFLTDDTVPGKIDETLFEENIRLYLGEKNEVNYKIYKSALSQNSAEFWYLNNGITIVCDSYKYITNLSNAPVSIKNPQIVNGGQTSFSLFEAYSKNFKQLEKVKVLVKIIETDDAQFRARIAEATNSQTVIRSRDLRSNDTVQITLEDALKDHGYFYERKNDQYADKTQLQRIDARKAGQIMFSYYHKEPDKAKSASEKIFGEYYDLIFDPHSINPEKLLACYKLYQDLETRKNIVVQSMKTKLKSQYEEAWIVEGIFHTLYMVGVLCERDGVNLEDYNLASTKINEAIEVVGAYAKSQKSVSAYRMFRSSKTKDALRTFTPAEQIELSFDKVDAA
jgi:hypothetical protein